MEAFEQVDKVFADVKDVRVLRLQVRAHFLYPYAWEARGTDFASGVGAGDAGTFQGRLGDGKKALEEAWTLESQGEVAAGRRRHAVDDDLLSEADGEPQFRAGPEAVVRSDDDDRSRQQPLRRGDDRRPRSEVARLGAGDARLRAGMSEIGERLQQVRSPHRRRPQAGPRPAIRIGRRSGCTSSRSRSARRSTTHTPAISPLSPGIGS